MNVAKLNKGERCRNVSLALFLCCMLVGLPPATKASPAETSLTFSPNVPQLGGGVHARKRDSVFRFLPLPLISYNRSLGGVFGIVPLAMYPLSKADTVSPASITGGVGLYTTNGTWMGMGFGLWFVDEDSWRITAAGGGGNINFQFYLGAPVGAFVDYTTALWFVYAGIQRKVVDHFYLGINGVHADLASSFDGIDTVAAVALNGIGILSSLDTRDDVYYPYNGWQGIIRLNAFPTFLANDDNSAAVTLEINRYIPVRGSTDVIALRFMGGFGLGELSFQQQFIVGARDLRGYTQGAYRGNQMMALQGEYRWNVLGWLSFVGFGGVATVFNSINEEDSGILLPAGGAGFRITVFPEYHMNMGIDGAVGRDDWGIYFRLAEAF